MNSFKTAARRYGHWAAARMACKLGITFEDALFGFFGRMPK